MTPLLSIDRDLVVVVALGVAVVTLIHLIEPGLWRWIRRGGPDYLDEPDGALCRRCARRWLELDKSGICGECWHEFDALLETAEANDAAAQMGDDFQQGFNRRDWPRDTGTR